MDPQLILTETQDALTARRVFGDPIHADGVTLVPAAIVAGGGGGGTGNQQGGVGFGVRAAPAGVFVVANGDVKWRPAVNVNRAILGGQIVGATALLVLGAVALAWLSRSAAAKSAADARFTAARAS